MHWLRTLRREWGILGGLLLAAAAWKVALLLDGMFPFNADEAIVALMARHILQGDRPLFFYGQAYMGSLDAYLAALGFWVFGAQAWVVRLVQVLLYLAFLVTVYRLGVEGFGSARTGLAAVLLLVVPPVNVTLYTTVSLGGYGEALLLGNLILLQALQLGKQPAPGGMALLGLLAGFGFWVHTLTVVYAVPALLWLFWQRRQKGSLWAARFLAPLAAGGLIGLFPWWLYVFQNGLSSVLFDFFGSAVNVEQGGRLQIVGLHLVNLFLLGLPAALGLRPTWSVEWLALPLLAPALMAWGAVLVFWARRLRRPSPERPVYGLFAGVAGCLFAAFTFSSFGVDPSGRYFLPLAGILALTAGEMAWSLSEVRNVSLGAWGRWGFLGLLVVFQVWGNLQVWRYPPGYTTQFDRQTIVDQRYLPELMAFLYGQGETRGYAGYWVSYPLAFESNEELIFLPRLPYHADLRYTARDDRYPPYRALVAESPRVAYISTSQTPLLDRALESGFDRLGVTYKRQMIGDYHVYYALSRAVRPEELSLGGTMP